MTNRLGLAGGWLAVAAAASLLLVGVTNDYRLKHEDNDALYSTFARAHLRAGLGVTHGQDLFVEKNGRTSFYGHHPGGPALLLAAAMKLSGEDSPTLTRGVALLCHLVGLGIFLRWIRPVTQPAERVMAALLYAVLPMGAFFGRMLNHEPLVLPAALLMAERYFAYLATQRRRDLWLMVAALSWAAIMGWAAFFVIGGCFIHSLLASRRELPGARRAQLWLATCGALALIGDLIWVTGVPGGSTAVLQGAFWQPVGGEAPSLGLGWFLHQVDVHRRYFTLTGLLATTFAGIAALRSALSGRSLDPLVERAAIFLAAGAGYVVAFSARAAVHHYWQFLLLPGVVLSLLAAARAAGLRPETGFRGKRLVASVALIEILATSTATLRVRHTRPEPYCLETVARLRSRYL